VKKDVAGITEIVMENGKTYRASVFIDATYEGDLMARAGVSYTVGRETNSKYNETLNGICSETPKHQFVEAVDPYLKPGDARSGLLSFIQSEAQGQPGAADRSVQAYNFRLCYTNIPPIASFMLHRLSTIRLNTNCLRAISKPLWQQDMNRSLMILASGLDAQQQNRHQ